MSSKESEDFVTGIAFTILLGVSSIIIIRKLAKWAESGRPLTSDVFDDEFRDELRKEIEIKVKRV